MKKNKSFYIDEILESISLIESYVHVMSIGDFEDNTQLFDAVCMRLQHIWETWNT